jgi:hypothetical protein
MYLFSWFIVFADVRNRLKSKYMIQDAALPDRCVPDKIGRGVRRFHVKKTIFLLFITPGFEFDKALSLSQQSGVAIKWLNR